MRGTTTQIGIDLPTSAKLYLAGILDLLKNRPEIKPYAKSIFWTQASNSFVPIIGLGHLSNDRLTASIETAKQASLKLKPYETNFGYLTYLFRQKHTNYSSVNLELQDIESNWKNMHNTLFNDLAKEAFYPPTRFKPAVPLCRIEKLKPAHLQFFLDKLTDVELPKSERFVVNILGIYQTLHDKSDSLPPRRIRSFKLLHT